MAKTKQNVHAFVDTNIFLDFYRTRNESTLTLLERLKPVRERVISTYQVEMEFLKNRQKVLLESHKECKPQDSPIVPAILADTATCQSLASLVKTAKQKTGLVRKRIVNLLKNPKQNDVVYQTLEEIFHSESAFVLTRDMAIRSQIKRLAFRRFLLGYPPRKQNDTSIGDALNWEWIIHCGKKLPGKIIIVSRDSDFGSSVDSEFFLNDQLLQEYRERVGPKKKIVYTHKLSQALAELHVPVPKKEIEAEEEAIARREDRDVGRDWAVELAELLRGLTVHPDSVKDGSVTSSVP